MVVVPTGEGELDGCFRDPLCRGSPPGDFQLLPHDPAERLPANHACTNEKPCSRKEFMTWKREKWLKGNPKRNQVFYTATGVFTMYFLRAPKPWIQQYGLDVREKWRMRPMKPGKNDKSMFDWVECIHPFCVSSLRHNVAAVLHSVNRTENHGVTPYYRLVDCKRETTLSLHERVKQCAKEKTLRFRMSDAEKHASTGIWNVPRKLPSGGKLPLEEGPMQPPTCAARAQLQVWMCNTCCCKAGTVSTAASVMLVQGSQGNCGTWLTFADFLVRLFISVIRVVNVIDTYGTRCFASMHVDNPNTNDTPAREKYCMHALVKQGKCKLGGSGKPLLSCKMYPHFLADKTKKCAK